MLGAQRSTLLPHQLRKVIQEQFPVHSVIVLHVMVHHGARTRVAANVGAYRLNMPGNYRGVKKQLPLFLGEMKSINHDTRSTCAHGHKANEDKQRDDVKAGHARKE